MRRIDILSPGRNQLAARAAIMATLPDDGTSVCYATLALAAGEDAGPIVEQLIQAGLVATSQEGGSMSYRRVA